MAACRGEDRDKLTKLKYQEVHSFISDIKF